MSTNDFPTTRGEVAVELAERQAEERAEAAAEAAEAQAASTGVARVELDALLASVVGGHVSGDVEVDIARAAYLLRNDERALDDLEARVSEAYPGTQGRAFRKRVKQAAGVLVGAAAGVTIAAIGGGAAAGAGAGSVAGPAGAAVGVLLGAIGAMAVEEREKEWLKQVLAPLVPESPPTRGEQIGMAPFGQAVDMLQRLRDETERAGDRDEFERLAGQYADARDALLSRMERTQDAERRVGRPEIAVDDDTVELVRAMPEMVTFDPIDTFEEEVSAVKRFSRQQAAAPPGTPEAQAAAAAQVEPADAAAEPGLLDRIAAQGGTPTPTDAKLWFYPFVPGEDRAFTLDDAQASPFASSNEEVAANLGTDPAVARGGQAGDVGLFQQAQPGMLPTVLVRAPQDARPPAATLAPSGADERFRGRSLPAPGAPPPAEGLPSGVAAVQGNRLLESLYTMPEEQLAFLQIQMQRADYYGNRAPVYGQVGPQDVDAFSEVVLQAGAYTDAGRQVTIEDLLGRQSAAAGVSIGGGGGGTIAGDPVQVVLSNPTSLRLLLERQARSTLGRRPSPDEVSAFVDNFHALQSQSQIAAAEAGQAEGGQAALPTDASAADVMALARRAVSVGTLEATEPTEAGAVDTDAIVGAPSPADEAESFLREENTEEFVAHEAATGYDALVSLMTGGR